MDLSTRRDIALCESWKTYLEPEFRQPYMRELKDFLAERKRQGRRIYPPGKLIFNALNSTPFDAVKVVILGQDPYHGPGQAHGLCFSVTPGTPKPPSLVNIFKELEADTGCNIPDHGCLQTWANRGVLLLNAVLTVEHQQAGSHAGRGWETFTDAVIGSLNAHREGVVFLLWGSYAQKKGRLIERTRHCVLEAPHPSPLSAHRGFFGSRPFSRANQYLELCGVQPVDWCLQDFPATG